METGTIEDLLHEGCTVQHLSSIADYNEHLKHPLCLGVMFVLLWLFWIRWTILELQYDWVILHPLIHLLGQFWMNLKQNILLGSQLLRSHCSLHLLLPPLFIQLFDVLNGVVVRCAALCTKGVAGPSGVDIGFVWGGLSASWFILAITGRSVDDLERALPVQMGTWAM